MGIFNKDKEKRQFKHQKNVDNSLKILQAIIAILDKHNITYYLDYGTLIGAIRDKGFILWDDDMDISLLYESDYKKIPAVLEDIKNLGFRTYLLTFEDSIKKAEKNGKGTIKAKDITFTSKDNYRVVKIRNNKFWRLGRGNNCLDIFFKYEKNGQLTWMAQNKVHSIDKNLLSNELIEIDFYHLKCKVPKNYDEYLTSMYGNWKTQKKDWQYYEHDTCLHKD